MQQSDAVLSRKGKRVDQKTKLQQTIRDSLVQISIQDEEQGVANNILAKPLRYSEEVSQWQNATFRPRKKDNMMRMTALDKLPTIKSGNTNAVFNSLASLEVSHILPHEALIVDRPSVLLAHKLNTVNLKLSYENPHSRIRKIIHNRQSPTANSLQIIRKIERKRKQMEMINKIQNDQMFPPRESRNDEIRKLLSKYPFERRVKEEGYIGRRIREKYQKC